MESTASENQGVEITYQRLNGDARKRQILRAAQHVFAEENYYGATINKIAKAIGVSEPTIYIHFKNKKDLFIAVVEDCARFEIETVKRAMEDSGRDILKAYRLLFERMFYFTLQVNPDPAKIFIINKVVNDPEIKAVVRRYNDELYSLVAGYLGQAMERGQMRDDAEPEVMARIMVSTVREMISTLVIDSTSDFEKYFTKVGAYVVRLVEQRPEKR